MTQQEKQELIVSLCSMLAYGVIVRTAVSAKPLTCEILSNIIEGKNNFIILPYLRSMESMTDEERNEYQTLQTVCGSYHYEFGDIVDNVELFDNFMSIDWLNAHHFDYRGLIGKGLALRAPERMYETVPSSIKLPK